MIIAKQFSGFLNICGGTFVKGFLLTREPTHRAAIRPTQRLDDRHLSPKKIFTRIEGFGISWPRFPASLEEIFRCPFNCTKITPYVEPNGPKIQIFRFEAEVFPLTSINFLILGMGSRRTHVLKSAFPTIRNGRHILCHLRGQ